MHGIREKTVDIQCMQKSTLDFTSNDQCSFSILNRAQSIEISSDKQFANVIFNTDFVGNHFLLRLQIFSAVIFGAFFLVTVKAVILY